MLPDMRVVYCMMTQQLMQLECVWSQMVSWRVQKNVENNFVQPFSFSYMNKMFNAWSIFIVIYQGVTIYSLKSLNFTAIATVASKGTKVLLNMFSYDNEASFCILVHDHSLLHSNKKIVHF